MVRGLSGAQRAAIKASRRPPVTWSIEAAKFTQDARRSFSCVSSGSEATAAACACACIMLGVPLL